MNATSASIPAIPALRTLLWRRVREYPAAHFRRRAVVFAPHQDDETLACGGTILKKRQAGADVGVVFVCDGSRSHAKLMDPAELAALRATEAREALGVLDVHGDDVRFLGFKEKKLRRHEPEAVERVLAILRERRPEEVFVPYRADVHPDHEATCRIVLEALRRHGEDVAVYEFPIWFWHRWPWVRVPVDAKRSTAKLLRDTLTSGFGFQHLRLFRHGVYVGDALGEKRQALGRHRSQTVRLNGTPDWPILADVAGGDFLACFFGPYEVFHRHRFSPST